MMEFSFYAYGHPNIRAMHRNTFEFTKDATVTVAGDCIIGINADFKIPGFFVGSDKVRFDLDAGGVKEVILAELNPSFCDGNEMVVRKSGFISDRTFAIRADKASKDFSQEFREKLSDDKTKIEVRIRHVEKTDA